MSMKVIQSSGKRKSAIARGVVKSGKGQIRINHVPLDLYQPEIARFRIQEVLEVATHDKLQKVDIIIKVKGGGISSQTDAVRICLAKAIQKYVGTKTIDRTIREYDSSLLSGDSRRVEPKKFGGTKARARRQKSFR